MSSSYKLKTQYFHFSLLITKFDFLSKDLTISAGSHLTVSLRGYAKIYTYELRYRTIGRGRHRHLDYYYVKLQHEETYFTINTPLVSAPVTATSAWTLLLNRGRNDYQFNFSLPTEIPSSYENEKGSIIYAIIVTMKFNSFWYSTITETKKIWVIATYNLAHEPMSTQPVERYQETIVCCLCCKTGPVSMTVKLHHMGYLPGEYVEFSVEIINNSVCTVSSTASLMEVASFQTPTEWNKSVSKLIVASAIGPTCLAGSTQLWERRCLQVPSYIVPTKLGGHSTFIDVRYQMVVTMKIGGRGLNSAHQTLLPIIIGTERSH